MFLPPSHPPSHVSKFTYTGTVQPRHQEVGGKKIKLKIWTHKAREKKKKKKVKSFKKIFGHPQLQRHPRKKIENLIPRHPEGVLGLGGRDQGRGARERDSKREREPRSSKK